MTFFYNLNKKLDEIRATPELTHKQLNERDMSRAAKGYEKYGKQGMEALAKAGREGKALDPVRAKYDKYDNTEVDEGLGDMARKVGSMAKKVGGAVLDKVGHGSDADMIRDLQRKMGMPQTGMKPGAEPNPKQVKEKMNPAKAKSFAALAEPKDKITFADKIAGAKKEVDEMLGDVAAEAMKSALSGGQKKLDKNKNGKLDANDFAMLRKGGKQKTAEEDDNNPFTSWKKPRAEKPKVGSIERGALHDIEHTATGRKVTRRVDQNTGYSVGTDDDGSADGEKRGRGRPKGTKGAIGAKGPSGKSKLMTREGDNESDEIKQAMAMLKKAGYKVTKAADGAEELEEKAVSKKQQRFMGMVHATQKGEKAPSKKVANVAKDMGKKDAEDFASTKHKGLPEKKKSDDAPKKKKTEEAGGTGTPTASSGFSYGKGIYDSMNHELESMIAEGMNVNMSMNSDAQGGPSKSLTVTATDDDAMKLSQLLKSAGLGGGDEGYGGTGYKSACGCGTPDCSCGDQEMDEAYGDTQATLNEPDYPTNTETAEDNFEYAGGLNKPKSTGQTTVPVIASQQERQESYAAEEEDAIKRMMEMAGQPASGAGAQVGDMIDYVSPSGEQPPEDLIMQNGVVYDPDTNVISVRNATSLANTHRAIEAAGWKKQTAGARPNPAAAGQAQQVGDTPYQLGEEDELARMMEMAGVKTEGKKPDFLDVDKDGNKAEPFKKAVDDKKEKKVDEGILAATANLWKEYKGNHGV